MWFPMLPEDGVGQADDEAAAFPHRSVTHLWDAERRLPDQFARALGIGGPAWDVYLLYSSGATWDSDTPPEPSFWMHQLGADTGAGWELQLQPVRLFQELLALLGRGVQPSRPDLGLLLHMKGLTTLTRDRS